jgi:uncharacterized membrane protein YcaP (DUF421 family)
MNIIEGVHHALGIHAPILTIWHMVFRALIVYFLGICITRLNKRFMGFTTVSDFFLYIIIGSILAYAITGPQFYETLGMAIILMLINWLVTIIDYYVINFKIIIEGQPLLLVQDGKIQWKAMRKCFITEHDLHTLLRTQTNTEDVSNIQKAYFESSGKVSFILKKQ